MLTLDQMVALTISVRKNKVPKVTYIKNCGILKLKNMKKTHELYGKSSDKRTDVVEIYC